MVTVRSGVGRREEMMPAAYSDRDGGSESGGGPQSTGRRWSSIESAKSGRKPHKTQNGEANATRGNAGQCMASGDGVKTVRASALPAFVLPLLHRSLS